ncbi:MAG TPA: ABC transporter ATP-binding protein [Firmicutes bacterium]|jgi:ABC-2 type transport system ATP-binding protein|nr:ABC transporter ATP-binding protein [Bacillota bacterium]
MLISVHNLVKRYGNLLALNHFHLQVERGEIVGLLGPNGSGKTTAINCILALLKYDKGEIKLFGKPMTPQAYDSKQKIGLVMQNVAVFDELRVEENIDYFCGLYIRDRARRRLLVQEAIDFVGLGDFCRFYPKKLSGGLLRRLNIACGLAHKPELLIFDEPTVGVDPQSRNSILEGIRELNRRGATVVYTSHYMEEVEQLCSRIVIMDQGKTLATGTTEELKALINQGETINVEIYMLEPEQLARIRQLPHVTRAHYAHDRLAVHYDGGEHNLLELLDYLKSQDISFSRVFSEQPTLNDVFLEITGRQLRD